MMLLLVLCTVSVSSGLAAGQLYSYGPSAGDEMLGASDTDSSDAIDLEIPFVLFGTNKTSLYVSRSCHLHTASLTMHALVVCAPRVIHE